jgi:2'-5' RNA ligase
MPFRAFVAVDLEEVPRLAAFQRALEDVGAQLKMVAVENLHLTLKFLGPTEDALVPRIARAMGEAVEDEAPFRARLRGAGAFPSLHYMNVVWVGMEEAEALHRIAARLDEGLAALGMERDRRGFAAHITLARVRGGRNKAALARFLTAHAETEFDEVWVDRIRLKGSVLTPQGPLYSTVEEVALGA